MASLKESMLPFESDVQITLEDLRAALSEQTEILRGDFKEIKQIIKKSFLEQREKGQKGEADASKEKKEEEVMFSDTGSPSNLKDEICVLVEVGESVELFPKFQGKKRNMLNTTMELDTSIYLSEFDTGNKRFGTMDKYFMLSWDGTWQSRSETLLYFLKFEKDYNRFETMDLKYFMDFAEGKIIKKKLEDLQRSCSGAVKKKYKLEKGNRLNAMFRDNG